MEYTPQNKKETQEMLDVLKIKDADELFDVIPKQLQAKPLEISGGLSELELLNKFKSISQKNKNFISFRGAGIYDHYIPALVSEITGRSEFWTAYTPYQAEASQGTLQAIFEYQSLICALTGLDCANASLYDGATAVAESALLAMRIKNKKKIVVSSALHPQYLQTLQTYLENANANIEIINIKDGVIDAQHLSYIIDEQTAGVIIQTPNFFGNVEDMRNLSTIIKSKNTLLISVVNPLSLAVFASPKDYDCDICVGEGQALGNSMSCGGTTFGFMAVKKEFMWKIPGRIIGQTIDKEGKRGFVLTLQSREQHIRREKATSNICTNASLNALAACVYMAGWSKQGFEKLANVNISKARYAFKKITSLEGFSSKFNNPMFFNEFVIETKKDIKKIEKTLQKNRILGPLNLSQYFNDMQNCLLFCITEQRTKQEIDKLVEILSKI